MIVDQKIKKQFVGVYLIDGELNGTQLATTIKPNWFRRIMSCWLLGWKWVNISDIKLVK